MPADVAARVATALVAISPMVRRAAGLGLVRESQR
jgi:hypothetical protein